MNGSFVERNQDERHSQISDWVPQFLEQKSHADLELLC